MFSKLLLLSFGALLALAATELVLRWFLPVQFHDWMEWIPDGHIRGRGKPESSFRTANGFEVRINELGFRGSLPAVKPDPGTYRILLLGGSAAFSYHASGERRTWAKVCESALSQVLGKPVEVINLSLPGFDTRTQLINYLILGRGLKPDAVIVYETWNDIKSFRPLEEDPLFGYVGGVASHNKPIWQLVAKQSQIALRIRNLLLTVQKRRRENSYTSLEKEGAHANAPVKQVAFDSFLNTRRDLNELLVRDGVLPIFVSQGNLAHRDTISVPEIRVAIDNDLVGMTLPVLVETLEKIRADSESLCGDLRCLFIDGYRKLTPSMKFFVDHVHLTDQGEAALGEIVANGIYDFIHRRYQD